MGTQLQIIKAVAGDANELSRLVNSAYRGEGSKAGWTTEADILDGIRIDKAALVVLLEKKNVTILKTTNSDGKILGTVCVELKGNDLYLGMFAVSPVAQGSGIGKSLMRAAEDFGIKYNCKRIVISVIATRTELIDWYERHGYVATGSGIAFEEIEGRFGDPKVDSIRLIEMEKKLAG